MHENWELYEIWDDKGRIRKGNFFEMTEVWNTNYLTDAAFEGIYGHTNRKPENIIKEWDGQLRLICILSIKGFDGPGKHTNKFWKQAS